MGTDVFYGLSVSGQRLEPDDQLLDRAATIALHLFHPADRVMLAAAQAGFVLILTVA
jgi:hypothetical protein